MNPEQILAASDTLGQLSNNLANMPEEQKEAIAMGLSIELVRLFLAELATYLTNGDDPYDALLKAAKGEMKIKT